MGNDCFSLIRCFLFQSFCGCKGTDFCLNLQYLKMIILAEIWLLSSDFPTYLFFT